MPARRARNTTPPDTPVPHADEGSDAAADAVERDVDAAHERDVDDDRIGRAVPESWDSVGFDDGHTYRCEHGRIVERIT